MNVFEELVVELKEENLLEQTVIDTGRHPAAEPPYDEIEITDEPNKPDEELVHEEPDPETTSPAPGTDEAAVEPAPAAEAAEVEVPPIKVKNGPQFFQKRAIAEVSSLQMVEHVLTGVEREYMRVVPKPFDDFNTKKALNAFLNVTAGVDSEEHKTAQFALMQETEAWCSALAERDSHMPVSSFRQYCENSKPALSSQAMLGLARFYRNLPYNETVRAKFDFIITRLFSRSVENEKRVCLFKREEALNHIKTLYAEWSSVPLYEVDEDDSNVMLTALSFEDLATEAENASVFDQLIESDFFGRLKLFKESISELFFAPSVTAAAIECNVRIGNAYVELIERERRKMDDESIQSKYGDVHADSVSEAAARTLDLVELLRNPPVHLPVQEATIADPADLEPLQDHWTEPTPGVAEMPKKRPPVVQKALDQVRAVNRWFLVTSALLVLASIGVWLWANTAEEEISTADVTAISTSGTFLDEHIQTAKVSQDVFYGLLKPSWDVLPKEKRQEYMQKVLQSCKEYKCSQVTFITKDGKTAGYASATRLDVNMP